MNHIANRGNLSEIEKLVGIKDRFITDCFLDYIREHHPEMEISGDNLSVQSLEFLVENIHNTQIKDRIQRVIDQHIVEEYLASHYGIKKLKADLKVGERLLNRYILHLNLHSETHYIKGYVRRFVNKTDLAKIKELHKRFSKAYTLNDLVEKLGVSWYAGTSFVKANLDFSDERYVIKIGDKLRDRRFTGEALEYLESVKEKRIAQSLSLVERKKKEFRGYSALYISSELGIPLTKARKYQSLFENDSSLILVLGGQQRKILRATDKALKKIKELHKRFSKAYTLNDLVEKLGVSWYAGTSFVKANLDFSDERYMIKIGDKLRDRRFTGEALEYLESVKEERIAQGLPLVERKKKGLLAYDSKDISDKLDVAERLADVFLKYLHSNSDLVRQEIRQNSEVFLVDENGFNEIKSLYNRFSNAYNIKDLADMLCMDYQKMIKFVHEHIDPEDKKFVIKLSDYGQYIRYTEECYQHLKSLKKQLMKEKLEKRLKRTKYKHTITQKKTLDNLTSKYRKAANYSVIFYGVNSPYSGIVDPLLSGMLLSSEEAYILLGMVKTRGKEIYPNKVGGTDNWNHRKKTLHFDIGRSNIDLSDGFANDESCKNHCGIFIRLDKLLDYKPRSILFRYRSQSTDFARKEYSDTKEFIKNLHLARKTDFRNGNLRMIYEIVLNPRGVSEKTKMEWWSITEEEFESLPHFSLSEPDVMVAIPGSYRDKLLARLKQRQEEYEQILLNLPKKAEPHRIYTRVGWRHFRFLDKSREFLERMIDQFDEKKINIHWYNYGCLDDALKSISLTTTG